MKIYHAETETYEQAHAVAMQVAEKVEDMAGGVTIGTNLDGGAIVMLTLPDSAPDPTVLFGGLGFYRVHALVIPQVPDQGIEGDETTDLIA